MKSVETQKTASKSLSGENSITGSISNTTSSTNTISGSSAKVFPVGPIIHVSIPFRDHIQVEFTGKTPDPVHWTIKACSSCLNLLNLLQQKNPDPRTWALPVGNSHSHLLIRELILKSHGDWQPPYTADEICHCRGVPTEKVICAIKSGAHTTNEVSRVTQASTSCGTCRSDVQNLLDYFLK